MKRKPKQSGLKRTGVLVLAAALVLMATAVVAQATDRSTQPMGLPHVATGGGGDSTGVATATYPGCPAGSDIVLLTGSGSDGQWTFSYNLNSACDGYMSSGSLSGSWDPEAGGCLEPANLLCLSNPDDVAPGIVEYDYVNNYEFHSGSATLTFL